MNADEIKDVLDAHKRWCDSTGGEGKRACLGQADLRGAYLEGANLQDADLRGADLRGADLRGANLCDADLRDADLRGACLWNVDMQAANLWDADLRDADLGAADLWEVELEGADLRGANLDFACLPLWCGSLKVKIDARIAAQLMYHAMRAMQSAKGDADVAAVLANADCIRLANRFHRVDECGKIDAKKEGGEE